MVHLAGKRQGYLDHHSNVIQELQKDSEQQQQKQFKNLLFLPEVEISMFCQSENKNDRDTGYLK